jgi:hypothetical protein
MPGLLQQALYARQQWQGQANGSKAPTGGRMICADSPKLVKLYREIVASDLSPFAQRAILNAIIEQTQHHRESCETGCWERAIEASKAAA